MIDASKPAIAPKLSIRDFARQSGYSEAHVRSAMRQLSLKGRSQGRGKAALLNAEEQQRIAIYIDDIEMQGSLADTAPEPEVAAQESLPLGEVESQDPDEFDYSDEFESDELDGDDMTVNKMTFDAESSSGDGGDTNREDADTSMADTSSINTSRSENWNMDLAERWIALDQRDHAASEQPAPSHIQPNPAAANPAAANPAAANPAPASQSQQSYPNSGYLGQRPGPQHQPQAQPRWQPPGAIAPPPAANPAPQRLVPVSPPTMTSPSQASPAASTYYDPYFREHPAIAPTAKIIPGNHRQTYQPAPIPQSYDLAQFRSEDSIATLADPGAIAAQAMGAIEALVGGMDADIKQQKIHLKETQRAAQALRRKAQQLQDKKIEYMIQSSTLGQAQQQSTFELQSALEELQALGKSPSDGPTSPLE